MKRAWKPGDVAMAHDERVFMDLSCEWRWVETRRVCLEQPPYGLRPLVVIDPEDREQVERLGHALYGAGFTATTRLADALREFADPKPPRPEEPTGLGAVVEDADGLRWFLLPPHVGQRWACWGEAKFDRDYSDLEVVRVLSEGVQP